MGAGACGVCPVGSYQAAVLRRPVASHGSLGVTPKGTVGVEVLLRLLLEQGKTFEDTGSSKAFFADTTFLKSNLFSITAPASI